MCAVYSAGRGRRGREERANAVLVRFSFFFFPLAVSLAHNLFSFFFFRPHSYSTSDAHLSLFGPRLLVSISTWRFFPPSITITVFWMSYYWCIALITHNRQILQMHRKHNSTHDLGTPRAMILKIRAYLVPEIVYTYTTKKSKKKCIVKPIQSFAQNLKQLC